MKGFAIKLMTVSLVGLLLLVAGAMVRGVVTDRLVFREQARQSVAESLAGAQTLQGVSLVLDYSEHYEEPVRDANDQVLRREARSIEHRRILVPETLALNGQLITEPRYRGLFRVNGYVLAGRLSGHFAVPELEQLPRSRKDSRLQPGAARLVFAVSDPRGLRRLELKLDGRALGAEAGTGLGGFRNGAQARAGELGSLAGRRLPFDLALELAGTDSLSMVPMARENAAALDSPWPHPSFGGRFLPVERSSNEQGFNAAWRISALATNASNAWTERASSGGAGDGNVDAFSVSLVDPVDVYVMADRASKYAVLFVVLTLGACLLFELLRRLQLHPLHYLLTGAALLMFFVLLLALAEHIGFGPAYGVAATACVALIGIYAASLLRSRWLAAGFTAGLALLYGALYGILLSEQNALLMGSLLLFALLASVMLATRKVDWHNLLSERGNATRPIGEGNQKPADTVV
ncbi:MAG: cell envelope integrity protein CreD [Moraxellaceae bacterium]|nr:cell envelope integrity protein CreD [Moraxellaceae bacterium]